MSEVKVLIVDDEESICWGLTQVCQQMSMDPIAVPSTEEALALAEKVPFSIVITDVRLPGMDGLSAIPRYHRALGRVPVIVITAFGDLRTAIDAIQKGAFEYIVKPFDISKVRTVIKQALATSQIRESQSGAESMTVGATKKSAMAGSSPIMQEVFKQVALTTTTNAPVLITGESGTGKELIARSIHEFGSSPSQPFVAINIATLSAPQIELELFGEADGGSESVGGRAGVIEQAQGGTLFLDEVAELPIEMQVKLLQVLDTGELLRNGASDPIKTDFRLITATHQDLLSQINHGDFRNDLFYRLRTFEIKLPPLRDRLSDIPELVSHFLGKLADGNLLSVSDSFLEALAIRQWPGNIRELQSVVERAATLARGGVLTADHVSPSETVPEPASTSVEAELQRLIKKWTRNNWAGDDGTLYEGLLDIIEPAIFSTAFELAENQYSAAARRLGIHRTTLKKKLSGDS